MENEIFEPWEHGLLRSRRLIIQRISDDQDGLTIRLNLGKNEPVVRVKFDPYVAYRNTNESFRANTVTASGPFSQSCYVVKNSHWISWFEKESLGYYVDSEIVHYALLTCEDWVEILSEFPPSIEIVK